MTGGEDDRPDTCRVCGTDYATVSSHDSGLMINLAENERFERVCVEPLAAERLRFYHHDHDD